MPRTRISVAGRRIASSTLIEESGTMPARRALGAKAMAMVRTKESEMAEGVRGVDPASSDTKTAHGPGQKQRAQKRDSEDAQVKRCQSKLSAGSNEETVEPACVNCVLIPARFSLSCEPPPS